MIAIHPLRRWLFEHRLSFEKFGEQVHLSKGMVSQIISGNRYPSAEAIARIRDATNGEVSADDLIPSPKKEQK